MVTSFIYSCRIVVIEGSTGVLVEFYLLKFCSLCLESFSLAVHFSGDIFVFDGRIRVGLL